MSLYTVFAWAAIVIAGGTYYWVYIRQNPLSVAPFQKANARQSLGENRSVSQKRKRKSTAPKQRTALQTNELLAGTSGISADESEGDAVPAKSRQQVQDETAGRAERKELLVDTQPPKKQVKRTTLSAPSDADESDAPDTPTPAPSENPSTGIPNKSGSAPNKNDAEIRFEKTTPKSAVDDMIAPEDRPAVARVMRISSPSQGSTESPARPIKPRADSSSVAVDKDGLTKKQRQNLKKKERHREARAREEAIRQSQLRAHQKDLETIRLNNQIKAAEKKTTQPNAWQQSDRSAMNDSVYTVRNLSEENLTTVGHRSDGAGSEEGWQEVTSKAAKKATAKSVEKQGGSSDGSEATSSGDDSEDGSVTDIRPAYATSNSFANLDS